MSTRAVTQLATQLQRDSVTNGSALETDRALLNRFLRDADEGAFEQLVRRHERMVRSAIAKVLPNPDDAEDAFQAVFLVLVRRAKSIDWRAGIGPWLYGVAHRVAVKARDASHTRTRKEKAAVPAEPAGPSELEAADLSWREACALLHVELDKLPDRYRLPLLLCYLEGKTRDEAATVLRVTVGTVKGRLERGRELLRARLARQGVALSAGLLAALAAGSARASSPPSISAVLDVVRGSVPARVLALTRETAVSTILSKLTKTVAGLVSVAVVASAVLGTGAAQPTDAPKQKTALPAPADAPSGAKPNAPNDPPTPAAPMVKIKGYYSQPGARSEPGATVAVWADGKKVGETMTSKDNMFHVAVPGPLPRGAKVVATKPGFAPDWADVPADPENTPVELRAIADDGVIDGRVTDLEGHPVANVPVVVERIGRPKPGKTLDEDIGINPKYRSRGTTALFDLDSIPAEAAGLPTRLTTDQDGKFKLTGAGKDRVLRITTRGETTEHLQVRVVTRPLDPKLEQHGPFGLHGSTFTLRVGPSRPIVGKVTDAKTGEPVPGMQVVEVHGHICQTVTDKDGKYRLVGVKKEAQYWLAIGSLGESPYFDANLKFADTSGLDALTADAKVYRGVVATGRVLDGAGKPVAGRIFYDWTPDNPHLKEFPGLRDVLVRPADWGRLDREGRYKLLVIPGPGALAVCASPEDAYQRLDTEKELEARGVLSRPTDAVHAVAGANFDPKDAKTLTHDFKLTAGKARSLVILGPDGQFPEMVLAVGQTETAEAKSVAGPMLDLSGLSAQRARAVVLFDKAKTVGALAAVTADGKEPVTITLQKLGTVTGRVFDADGAPAEGAQVRVWLVLDRAKYDNLPDEVFTLQGVSGIGPGAWDRFTGLTVKTDKDGRFELPGLLPGQRYRLVAGFNIEKQGGEIFQNRTDVTVKAGEKLDLGDLKPKK
jgi:RNA polymerase sigma factor (sigma-70 family)